MPSRFENDSRARQEMLARFINGDQQATDEISQENDLVHIPTPNYTTPDFSASGYDPSETAPPPPPLDLEDSNYLGTGLDRQSFNKTDTNE